MYFLPLKYLCKGSKARFLGSKTGFGCRITSALFNVANTGVNEVQDQTALRRVFGSNRENIAVLKLASVVVMTRIIGKVIPEVVVLVQDIE